MTYRLNDRFVGLLSAVCFVSVCTFGFAQDAKQDQKISHEKFLEEACKNPLQPAPTLGLDGKPLSGDAKASFESASAKMEKAQEAFDAGRIADAGKLAEEALPALRETAGDRYYLSISAAHMIRMAKSPFEGSGEVASGIAECKSLIKDGRYIEARDKAISLLEKAKSLPDTYSPLIGLIKLELGTALTNLLEYNEANKVLQESAQMVRRDFGAAHPRYADTQDKVGWVQLHLSMQGEFDREKVQAAADALSGAVTIYRATIGDAKQTAESLDNLGTVFFYLRKPREALSAKLRAMCIRENLLGPEDIDTGVSCSNMAWLYSRDPQTNDFALPLRRRALEIFNKKLREGHPWISFEESNLAWDLYQRGEFEEAIAIYERINAREKKNGEKGSVDIAQRSARLGEVYFAAGNVDKGIACMDETFEEMKAAFTDGREEMAMMTVREITRAAKDARIYDRAATYQGALADWERQTQKDPKDLSPALRAAEYGALLIEVGKSAEAAKVLEQAIADIEKAAGKGEKRLIVPLVTLARAYWRTGKLDEASKLCDRAVQISESQTGSESGTTAYMLMWQGKAYTLTGSTTLAEFSFESSMEIFEKYKDIDPSGAMRVKVEYALCLAKQNRIEDAMKNLKEALLVCREQQEKNLTTGVDSALSLVLRTMVDITAEQSSYADQRKEWKRDALESLERLKDKKALDAEEAEWLAKNGQNA